MAVYSDYFEEPRNVGSTIGYFEHNGYDDSDYYAVVWNDEEKKVDIFEYMTTRFPVGGSVTVDATEDVRRKVYRHFFSCARVDFDKHINIEEAKKVRKGDSVTVIKGRKVKKGTVGKVFWVGTKYNYYTYHEEDRVGIEDESGEKYFLPLEYVEVNGWENRLVHGKERKERIRKRAFTLAHNMFVYCI